MALIHAGFLGRIYCYGFVPVARRRVCPRCGKGQAGTQAILRQAEERYDARTGAITCRRSQAHRSADFLPSLRRTRDLRCSRSRSSLFRLSAWSEASTSHPSVAGRWSVSPPKCRYKTQNLRQTGKRKKSCHRPFPTNNPIAPTKKLKLANEKAACSFLCRIYLHRSRLLAGAKKLC
jgi:hypothetical protein